MIDLHCHLLPGVDDGAPDLATSLDMARIAVADGIGAVACTPHILPGVYDNTGPEIRMAVDRLQRALRQAAIPLKLVAGADAHLVPDFVAGLREGRILALNGTRYVLVEPPHNVAPPRLDETLFNILSARYVPILTHPERLTWIERQYDIVPRLVRQGVWMQVTAGSLTGRFGRRVRALAERMLDEGCVHILATDAHDPRARPPLLREAYEAASARVGAAEAKHLVYTRPAAILSNAAPDDVPPPPMPAPRADPRPPGLLRRVLAGAVR